MFDYVDFYIKNETDLSYNPGQLVEEDIISVILQKYRLILFTNKGELLGDPNFGADLELLLYQTKVSDNYVRDVLIDQINTYIAELAGMEYSIQVVFTKDINNYYDIMFIYFKLNSVKVFTQIGKITG